jgi:hypothetical protein
MFLSLGFGLAYGSNFWSPATVPICMVSDLDYVKISEQKIMIDIALIPPFIVHEPNAIQAIVLAIVTYTKSLTVTLSKILSLALMR